MKYLKKINEYLNRKGIDEDLTLLEIIRKWISWSYKEFPQSKFLYVKKLFPFLLEYQKMYRGIDINYLKYQNDLNKLKDLIWKKDEGKYVSWCRSKKQVFTIFERIHDNKFISNYITIIKQKNIGLDILSVIRILSERDFVYDDTYEKEWSDGMAMLNASIAMGEVSEIVSPLSKDFTIEGVYDIYEQKFYPFKEWIDILPEIIKNKKSTFYWERQLKSSI